MKILTPIGSKERFLEMYQGVNKINLKEAYEDYNTPEHNPLPSSYKEQNWSAEEINAAKQQLAKDGVNVNDLSQEEIEVMMVDYGNSLVKEESMGALSPLDAALDALINDNLNIEQVNNQVSGDESIVEISGTGGELNITFKFKVHSSPTDQDGVNSVDGADLIYAKINDNEVDENALASTNANRQEDLVDAISEYVEFESTGADDEMFEDAVKFIDNVPYNKGSEEIQTQKAYADQKPTNPALRVKSPELDKFVTEIQDYQPDEEPGMEMDPTAMPPEFGNASIPNAADDGSVGVDPYDSIDTDDDFEVEPELAPERVAIINQAYEKLVQSGNPSPTMEDTAREANRMEGIQTQPAPKTRTIPRGAEEFYESTDQDKFEDVVFMQGEEADEPLDILRNQGKDAAMEYLMQWHDSGNHMGSAELGHGSSDQTFEKDGYTMAWNIPLNYIGLQYDLSGLDEDEETYPKQMGKKFKPKNQMPKKKKKPQSVVKLSEEVPVPDEYDEPNMDMMKNAPEDVEQVMQDKDEAGDELEGGLADDKSSFDFCPKQIAKGIEVEMEHTENPLIAIEIVMDHLVEDEFYYGQDDEDPEAAAMSGAQADAEGTEDDEMTDELLGFKPHNVGDYANVNEMNSSYVVVSDGASAYVEDMNNVPEDASVLKKFNNIDDAQEYADLENAKISGINEEEYEEYQGNVGDRYADAEGNEFSVRDKTKGGVTLKGQGGEKEVNTSSLSLMKNLGEAKKPKEVISEAKLKLARQALNKRGLNEGMTKKEAIQLLIKNNIR